MRHIAVLLLLIAACGSESHGGPAPLDAGVGAGGAGVGGGSGGEAPTPTKRTIIQRNPFGNVEQADNLLWDGDFEWRSPFADQYGWLSGNGSFLSYAMPALALGEACRSGLKCATVPAGHQIVGLSLGSREAALAVSFWARPESGACDDVLGVVTDFAGGPQHAIPAPAAPEADGWCRFAALVTESGGAPILFIRNEGGAPVVVDDAVIAPVTAGEAALVAAPKTSLPEMDAIRRAARRATEPRRAPPNAAARALEAHLKRITRGRR